MPLKLWKRKKSASAKSNNGDDNANTGSTTTSTGINGERGKSKEKGSKFFSQKYPVKMVHDGDDIDDVAYIDDGEPLSFEEEVSLHHASQYANSTSDYSLVQSYQAAPKRLPSVPTPTGILSIDSIMNTPPDLPATKSEANSSSSSLKNAKIARRLSSRLSFIGITDSSSSTMMPVPKYSTATSSVNSSRSSSLNQTNNGTMDPPSSKALHSGTRHTNGSNSGPAIGSSNSVLSSSSLASSKKNTHNPPLSPPPLNTGLNTAFNGGSFSAGSRSNSNLKSGKGVASSDSVAYESTNEMSKSKQPTPSNNIRPTSPTTSSSDSGCLSGTGDDMTTPKNTASPASSMIFERNVQDLSGVLDNDNIPVHYQTENFIPPVLDASTNAITDSSIDPEEIEVVSMKSRGVSVSQPLDMNIDSNTLKNISPSDSPSLGDKHVLSFYSYADILSSESAPKEYPSDPHRKKSDANSPSQGINSGGLQSSISDSFGSRSLADTSELTSVSSMGETLRRHNDEIASAHVAYA